MTKRFWKAATLGVLLTVAVACGDDDNAATTTAPAVETTDAASPETTGGEAPETTAGAVDTTAEPGEPIRIGAVLSVTGPGASLGEQQQQALELVIGQMNDAGGYEGHPIELEVADDQSNPDRAVEQMRALIADFEPHAVIGGSLSGVCLATKPVTEELGVLQYCLSAANIPAPAPLYFSAQSPLARWVADLPFQHFVNEGYERIGCLASDDASGQLTVDVLKPAAAGAGIELFVETFNVADVDVSTQLTKLRGNDLDAMYVCTSGAGVVTVLQGMQQLGIDIPTWIGSGSASLPVAELIKDVLPEAGVLTGGEKIQVYDQLPADDPQAADIMAFAEDFENEYGRRPDLFAASAVDALNILLQGISAVGTDAEPADVAKWLEDNIDYLGLQLHYDFTADDHRGTNLSGIVVRFTDDGTFELVAQYDDIGTFVADGS